MFNEFHQAVTLTALPNLPESKPIIADQTQKLREFSTEQIRAFEQTHQRPAEQSPQPPGVSKGVNEAGPGGEISFSATRAELEGARTLLKQQQDELEGITARLDAKRSRGEVIERRDLDEGAEALASQLDAIEQSPLRGSSTAVNPLQSPEGAKSEEEKTRESASQVLQSQLKELNTSLGRSDDANTKLNRSILESSGLHENVAAGLLRLPYHCPAAMAYSSNFLYQVPAIMMLAKENYQFPPLDDEHKRINFDYGSILRFMGYLGKNDAARTEFASYFPESRSEEKFEQLLATTLEYLRTAKAKTANRPYDAPKNVFNCTGTEPSDESGAAGVTYSSGGPPPPGGFGAAAPAEVKGDNPAFVSPQDVLRVQENAADLLRDAKADEDRKQAEQIEAKEQLLLASAAAAKAEAERVEQEQADAKAAKKAQTEAAAQAHAAERAERAKAAQIDAESAEAPASRAGDTLTPTSEPDSDAGSDADDEDEQGTLVVAAAAAAAAAAAKATEEEEAERDRRAAAAAAAKAAEEEKAERDRRAAAAATAAEVEKAARDRRAAAEAAEEALETKYKNLVVEIMKRYAVKNFKFRNDRDKERDMQLIDKWGSWLLAVIGGVGLFEEVKQGGGMGVLLGSLRDGTLAAYALGVVFGDNEHFLRQVEGWQQVTYDRFVGDCKAILEEMKTFGRMLLPDVFGIGPLYTRAGEFVNKQVINALAKTLSNHHSPTDCRLQTFSRRWADYVKGAGPSGPDLKKFNKDLGREQKGLPRLPELVTDLIGRRLCLWIPAMIDQSLKMNTLGLDEIFNYLIVGMHVPSMIEVGRTGYISEYRPFRMRSEGVDEAGSAIYSSYPDKCANYWIKHEMVEGWAQVAGRGNATHSGLTKVSPMGPYQYQFVYPDGSDLKQRLFGRPLFKPNRDSQDLFWGVAQSLPFEQMMKYMSKWVVDEADYPMLCAAVEVGLNDVIYARAKKEQDLLHGLRDIIELPLYPIRIRCPQGSAAEERTFAYIESQREYTSFAAIDSDATSLYFTDSEDPITNEAYFELMKKYGARGDAQKFREYANARFPVEDTDFGGAAPK